MTRLAALCSAIALSLGTMSIAQGVAPATPPLMKIDVHEGTSMAVSVSPDGKWLAIDLQGGLWLLPSKGGTARRITDAYSDARQPVWSPDGQTLAFFSYREGGYDLWTVKPDGSALKKLTWGAFDDRDPIWSPDGKRLAFASDRGTPGQSSYNIWTVDVASGALQQVTHNAFENRMPSWSPDGRRIAYSSTRDGSSGLFATTVTDGTEQPLRDSKGTLEAPSWTPDGRLLYVEQIDGTSVLKLDGAPVSGTENAFPFRASWQGTRNDFYYVSDGLIRRRTLGKEGVQTVRFTASLDAIASPLTHSTRDFDSIAPRRALGIVRPALSPDGKQVAFTALGDLYLMEIGGKPQRLTSDRFLETDVAFSPDGKQLVYSSDKGGQLQQLWIRDLKTGKERQLTHLDTQPLGAAWSPDGKRIAFIDADGMWGVAGLCTVDVATGKVTRLQPSLGQPGRPTWSADGKHVAIPLSLSFSKSFREGTNQVYVVPADGQGAPTWYSPVPNLSIDTRGGAGPVWSPDGTQMAAIYEGELRVWPVAPNGAPLGPPRSLTSEIAHSPSWSGDSSTLLYQSADQLKRVDVNTGRIDTVPLALDYTLAKPSGRTVIHAGRVFDGRHEALQENMDVVVEGNRITSVVPHDPALHASAKVVDGSEQTLMPGLIEFHAHFQKDHGEATQRAWLAWGITTVRDPGSQPYDMVEEREANEAGVRIGPRMYITGHLLEWQRVYYKMGIALSGPAHLEKELARSKALHYDLLKSYVRMPDPQQKRLTEFAHHEMGVPVTTHEIYPAALTGVDNTEHIGATSRRGYATKQGPLGRAYEDVVQLFGKTGRPVTPTNFGSLITYLDKHPALRDDPRLQLYPQWAQKSVHNTVLPARLKDAMPGTAKAIVDIAKAGGRIAAGTDTPIAINYHAELASYVDAGMTPFQALQAGTLTPATLLGLDAGAVEAGKLADLVLVDGNPLQDISDTTRVRQVISNGRVFDQAALLHPAAVAEPAR
ncbi:MAG: amidohydrolase family protein [Pseudoxanthomonas sp.]